MVEVVCSECEWSGKWSDIIHNINDKRKDYCPECYSEDLIDLDAVGPDDYEKQERRGHVTE